ncbi:phenylacetate--CoA ligase family protein [Algiphilus sp.]|uniref:phenylacetate--CoA ligase family protein n=1 Tax=Algiphilus sp. TaxID=1872431 RepID=UPI003C3CD292
MVQETPSPHRDETAFFDAVEALPRDALSRLQEQRLLPMVRHVYEHSALVRHNWDAAGVHPRDIKSVADFKRLAPFMDKDQIRDWRDEHDDPFGGILCIPPRDVSFIASSSGTTGDPTLFSWQWGSRDGLDPACPGLDPDGPSSFWPNTHRDLWQMGVRPGEVIVMLANRIRGPVFRVLERVGAIPLLLSHEPDDLCAFLEMSRRYRPTVLFTASNPFIHQLEQLASETRVDMRDVFSSYKAVMFAGEPMGPRSKRLLESWGLEGRIFNQTAFGDIAVAHECTAHDGMHAHEDIALVELVDPQTGDVIEGDGVGELCVTSLLNHVDPLIRYRSGDMVRITSEPCACGRTGMRYWAVGRSGDEVVVDDRTVLPMDVWGAVEDVAECSAGLFQIIRADRHMPALRLRVGHNGTGDPDAIRRRLIASVHAAVGLRPEIELVPDDELLKLGPPNKIPRTAKQ